MSLGSPLAPGVLVAFLSGGDAVLDPSVLLHFVLAELCPGDVIVAVSAAPPLLRCQQSALWLWGKLCQHCCCYLMVNDPGKGRKLIKAAEVC